QRANLFASYLASYLPSPIAASFSTLAAPARDHAAGFAQSPASFSTLVASHSPLPPATSMAGRHTIILMQPSQNRASRTFMDYNSINHALDGICGLYERKIRDINPMVPNITYDISDLYNFIDGLADISALVFDHSIQAFLPYDRQWIKQKLFQHLKKLSQR
ncbi:unnamed protein product, partial [Urochloa humidicola]